MMIGRILLALALAFCFAAPASAQASQSAPFVTAPGSYNAIDATQQTGLSASTTSATFSGTTMTVNTASVGVFTVGMTVTFSGSAGQTITHLGTYAGSTGTLTLSASASGTAVAASGSDTSSCAKISAAATAANAISAGSWNIDARGFTGTPSCGGSMFANWPAAPFYADVQIGGNVTFPVQTTSPSNGRIITEPLPRYEFDVRAYGAKGDGVTDDTAAIQAAETASEGVLASIYPLGGRVLFPCGSYLVHTGPIVMQAGSGTQSMSTWKGVCGTNNLSSSGPYYPGATLFSDVASSTIVSVVSSGGEAQNGPRFIDLGFAGSGSGSRSATGISINNVMRGIITRSSFSFLAVGTTLQGAGDDSGWVINSNTFLSNITAVSFATPGAANNIIYNNRFDSGSTSSAQSDEFVVLNEGASQVRIEANHFACNYNGVSGQTAIVDQANQVGIVNNDFENCEPAVSIPAGTTGARLWKRPSLHRKFRCNSR